MPNLTGMDTGTQIVRRSSAKRTAHMRRIANIVRTKSRQKSRVANGSALLPGLDGRSLWARRAKELLAAHIQDLGGPDHVSEAERALAKRCAVLVTELERREASFARDGEVSDQALAIYQTTTLEALGLQRRAKDVTPNLQTYLRTRQGDDGVVR